MIATNSKRPKSIKKDKMPNALEGKKAKVLSGPISFPNAGPIFDNELTAPEKQVTKSRLQKDNATVPITKHTKYNPIKVNTPKTTSSATGTDPYLGTNIPCGLAVLFNLAWIIFIITEILNNLIPPVVDPVHPPGNIKKRKAATAQEPHIW